MKSKVFGMLTLYKWELILSLFKQVNREKGHSRFLLIVIIDFNCHNIKTSQQQALKYLIQFRQNQYQNLINFKTLNQLDIKQIRLKKIVQIRIKMSRSCYYHPDNTLHNFCINTECALPLCPKCINIHLNQSNQKHHIQSLSQTRQMIREQLETSIQAIEHNLNAIKIGEYTPEACVKQYTSIVQKYRQQAINMINEHYDYIKRELFEQLKSKFTCHLGNLIAPLEENILELKKHRKSLEQKPIQCMIKVVSQQTIVHVEKLLQHIAEKKQTFKMELPRLEGIEGNKLKIIPGGIQRVAIQSYHQTERHSEKSIYSQATNKYYNQANEFDRINRLQAELNSLRV